MELGVNYQGFVEGSDLVTGNIDVVVTDGFTGNVSLKTAEGISALFSTLLRRNLDRSLISRIGYLFARNAIKAMRRHIDPATITGRCFWG